MNRPSRQSSSQGRAINPVRCSDHDEGAVPGAAWGSTGADRNGPSKSRSQRSLPSFSGMSMQFDTLFIPGDRLAAMWLNRGGVW